jgi:hypothetical protein
MITHYFGTDINNSGHYSWTIKDNGTRLECTWMRNFELWPFHPEYINNRLSDGEINWLHSKSSLGEFTVCAITGSCKDQRPGCKSVFIISKIISFEEMKQEILSTPICKTIIDKMPFEIKW